MKEEEIINNKIFEELEEIKPCENCGILPAEFELENGLIVCSGCESNYLAEHY